MKYVDGFVLPVPVKNVDAYRRMAQQASKVWKEHGALEYRECVGDDLNVKMGLPFADTVKLKRGETVVFAWIVYKSRAHRDAVNAKVMKDPRLAKMMELMKDKKAQPFDHTRMAYGGFKVIVDA
ncbi:MAG: DUF1428 domain-containing protein [Pyrinomonadaceae bacterium]|nr:DUF1428 domain-containing protein [Pyrinomonadaceae bacterium]